VTDADHHPLIFYLSEEGRKMNLQEKQIEREEGATHE